MTTTILEQIFFGIGDSQYLMFDTTTRESAVVAVSQCEINHTGYVTLSQSFFCNSETYLLWNHSFCEVKNTQANKRKNKKLRKNYNRDPRIFWNNLTIKATFSCFLVSFAIFTYSTDSSSPNCERVFNRINSLVCSRCAAITDVNQDKRLTITNQIP